MAELLTVDDLPPGFEYPREFIRIVELDLTSLEPWWMLTGEQLLEGLRRASPALPRSDLHPVRGTPRQRRHRLLAGQLARRHNRSRLRLPRLGTTGTGAELSCMAADRGRGLHGVGRD